MREMEIEHFSHKHPLIFAEEHKDDDDDEVEVCCNVCQQPISGSPSYNCRHCKYSLHKLCAELPREIEHHLHLHHSLTLLPNPPYPRNGCGACRRSCENFTYHCPLCEFNLDVTCALMAHKIELSCHEHPLTPLQRPALFLCDACGNEHKGLSYQCTTCQFWINQKCALLPSTIEHSDHEHLLSLAYSLPYEDYRSKSFCDLCSKKLNRVNWVYYCAKCKYCVHVNCATSKTKLNGEKKTIKESEHNLIRLPLPPFVKESNMQGKDIRARQIYHVSHNHPLCVIDMQINDESSSGSQQLLCDGCAEPISARFYHCAECNFSLHVRCATLPIELRHPGHPEHPLILNRWQSVSSDLPLCQGCKMHCNGVLFSCLICNFFLDIGCALLQGVIVHEAHKHNLSLRKTSNVECAACGYSCSGVALGCGTCNFNLHLRCAFLPRTVWHRGDKHPLTLIYSALKFHSDNCDICKVQLNTKCWYYYCIRCNKSLQTQCIHEADVQGSSLFIIKHEAHIHTLSLEATLDFQCAGCNYNCSGVAFVCEICKFRLDTRCAFLPHTVRHRYDQHPYNITYLGNQEEYYCDICEGEINPECWFYHCRVCDNSLHTICIQVDEYSNVKIGDELSVGGHPHLLTYVQHDKDISACDSCGDLVNGPGFECLPCNFRLHFCCARNAANERMLLLPQQLDIVKESKHNLIHLPLPDESINLIPNVVKNSLQGKDKKATQIYHVSHHHPLCFVDMQINDELCSGSKLLLCDGCAKPISVPFYGCVECNFSLHEWCAKLPVELRHPSHPEHPLILSRWQSEYSILPLCQTCKMHCNGILFSCLACNFFLDIECALLHGVIVHEGHEHSLALRKTSNLRCAACEYSCYGFGLVCGPCNFTLHLPCAFFPRTVRHRFDEHPLTLTYSSVRVCSCEICKSDQQLIRKCWFYHCGDCNQSFHTKCIRKADIQGSSLFIIKHEAHEHTLALEAELDFCCAGGCCSRYSGVVFICDICNFKLDTRCAFLRRTVRHRSHEHPYTLSFSVNDQKECYCDFCKKEIEPWCWFYQCAVCCQFLHTMCVQGDDECSNIKIGSKFNFGGHPHHLTFVRQPMEWDMSPCDHCGKYFTCPGFECAPCNFAIHFYCAGNAANEGKLLPQRQDKNITKEDPTLEDE